MHIWIYLSIALAINGKLLAETAQSRLEAPRQDFSQKMKAYFSGSKSLVFDMGFSTNLLLSDASTKVSGMGLGQQFGLHALFNAKESRGFKLSLMQITAKQNNFRKSPVAQNPSQLYRQFQQDWTMFGLGLETRQKNRLLNWYWDFSLGYAFGRNSNINTQSDGIAGIEASFQEPSRSGLYLAAGSGVRRKIAKNWALNGNLRSFLVLGSLYSGQLRSQSLLLLPLMASFGAEYNF